MKKIKILLVILLLICLVGCTNTTDKEDNNNQEKTIITSTIDSSTIPSSIEAFNFDVATIKIKALYTDGTSELFPLKEEYFSQSEFDKFNIIGNQTISLTYNSEVLNFNIKVIKGSSENYNINSIVANVTTENSKYLLRVTTNTKAILTGTCTTNEDMSFATLTINLDEFVIDANVSFEFKLNGNSADNSGYEIKDNKLTFVFSDAFWSPIA